MIIPEVTFKTRVGDNEILGGACAIGGEWKNITTNELFKNKKIVLFSLPGAFTPTCSSQQLPGYEIKYEELKKRTGFFAKLRLQWFVIFASLRDTLK